MPNAKCRAQVYFSFHVLSVLTKFGFSFQTFKALSGAKAEDFDSFCTVKRVETEAHQKLYRLDAHTLPISTSHFVLKHLLSLTGK